MRQFLLLVLLSLCLPSLALAAFGSITLESVTGQVGPTYVDTGMVTFHLRVAVSIAGEDIVTISNGFELYSPNGATWPGAIVDTNNGLMDKFESLHTISYWNWNGAISDTFAIHGVSSVPPHLPAGFSQIGIDITVPLDANDIGKQICIDSVTTYPGSGHWQWVDATFANGAPTWLGPYCFTVVPSGYAIEEFQSSRVASTVIGDLDMDNNPDLVVAKFTAPPPSTYVVTILWGNSSPPYSDSLQILSPSSTAAVDMQLCYLTSDTLLDLFVADSNGVYFCRNLGSRDFGVASTSLPGRFPSVAPGHLNNDPYIDIVQSGKIIYGDGSGWYDSTLYLSNYFDVRAVGVNDYNRDGFEDIIGNFNDTLKIILNPGTLTAFSPKTVIAPLGPYSAPTAEDIIARVDFNHDGKPDFAATGREGSFTRVYIGQGTGTGTFIIKDTLQLPYLATQLTVADYDRDGFLDIATAVDSSASLTPGSVWVYFGNGAGLFTDSLRIPFGTDVKDPVAIASSDLERDGDVDLVTANGVFSLGPVVILRNQETPLPILPDEMVVTLFSQAVPPLATNRTPATAISTASPQSGPSLLNLEVENPAGLIISQDYSTVSGSAYWELDVDGNNAVDDRTFDYNLLSGEYTFVIRAAPGSTGGNVFTMDIRIDGSSQVRLFYDYASPAATMSDAPALDPAAADSIIFYYTVEPVSSIQPPNGLPSLDQTPTFDWSLLSPPAPGKQYEFQTSDFHDCRTTLLDIAALAAPTYTPTTALAKNRIYYWRFRSRASSTAPYGPWSRVFAAYIKGCCEGKTGNVNKSATETPDLSDLALLIAYLTQSPRPSLPCDQESNINNTGGTDLSDLSLLISYLTSSPRPALPNCP